MKSLMNYFPLDILRRGLNGRVIFRLVISDQKTVQDVVSHLNSLPNVNVLRYVQLPI